METILDSDPELLARYKQEKRYQKREVILAYLREYNQRNRFEIDLLGQEPEDYSGKVVLFRKMKKEGSEELEVSIDKGKTISMKPGETFTLEIRDSKNIQICIGSSDCFDFKGERLKAIYVEISKKDGETAATATQVEKKVANFYLQRFKHIDQKRN
ncbi:MAG: hypothetical protein AAGA80_28850 [Cyanobacteria bacterium P01_F01_bin.143]